MNGRNGKNRVYTATVIDNNDPRKMGRVKTRIDVMHGGVPDSDLPWSTPVNGSAGKGSTDIPSIGEQVYVEFPNGDMHEPQFKGNVINGDNLSPVFKTNYPHRKGFVSQFGSVFYRDESNGDIHFSSPTGISIDFQGDNITINTTGSIVLNLGNGATLNLGSSTTFNAGGMSCVVDNDGITITNGDVVADGVHLK